MMILGNKNLFPFSAIKFFFISLLFFITVENLPAQLINVDFCSQNKNYRHSKSGAGAVGTKNDLWNIIPAGSIIDHNNLIDSKGRKTSISFRKNTSGYYRSKINHNQADPLLYDYTQCDYKGNFVIDHLDKNCVYNLYLYSDWGYDNHRVTFTVNGVGKTPSSARYIAKKFVKNGNYVVFRNIKGHETLSVTLNCPQGKAPFNGFQLEVVGCPSAKDFKKKYVRVTNSKIELTFLRDNYNLVSLRDPVTGHEFITPELRKGGLWKFDMLSKMGEHLTIDNAVRSVKKHRWLEDKSTLHLFWSDIVIDGKIVKDLSVQVSIRLDEVAGKSYWNIKINNSGKNYTLSTVYFPYIKKMPTQIISTVPRGRWGYVENAKIIRGDYPSYQWTMEFLCFHDGKNGLYLGYEDGKAYPKKFLLEANGPFYFSTLSENYTVFGNSFESPGRVAIGVAGKNWYNSAKMYRNFALKQFWTAKGKLSSRKDIHQLEKIGLWFRCIWKQNPQITADIALKAKEFFNVPLGIHCYYWSQQEHDVGYPKIAPPIKGFKEFCRKMKDENILIMPYINARLADKNTNFFHHYKPCAIKKTDGHFYEEKYLSKTILVPMCPATAQWRKTIIDNCKSTIENFDIPGVYLDQIAAGQFMPCYDKTHGHHLGGGNYWVKGYNQMLRGIKKATGAFLVSENNSEPYMGELDMFLNWAIRYQNEVPMQSAVYGGYTMYMGTKERCDFDDSLQPFVMHWGREFLWGGVPGWQEIGLYDFNKSSKRRDYLKKLVQLRMRGLKYCLYGELLGDLPILSRIPRVHAKWYQKEWCHRPMKVTLPSVMGTVWRAEDGTLGVFMANLSGKKQEFDTILNKEWFGKKLSDCVELCDNGVRKNNKWQGEKKHFSLCPWELKIIILK